MGRSKELQKSHKCPEYAEEISTSGGKGTEPLKSSPRGTAICRQTGGRGAARPTAVTWNLEEQAHFGSGDWNVM